MSSSDASMSLKLLIDSQSNKVLFAEADKEFVDFIFSLLAIPLGTVIKLISAKSMVGSLGRLYESVEKLSETYLQPNENKSSLLQPKIGNSAFAPLLFAGVCPESPLSISVKNASDHEETKSSGFVRGVYTYMVMDDLEVLPMSAISSISLINKFNMKNIARLEEKIVSVGMEESLALLQAALESKSALTAVFLKGRKTRKIGRCKCIILIVLFIHLSLFLHEVADIGSASRSRDIYF